MDFTPIRQMMDNIGKVVVGKEPSMELLMVALLADGHVLLEDVPGLGKTLMAKSLAKSFDGTFKRIQFTPDLLPSDITGFNIFDRNSGQFKFQPGPVTTNILLADEINRAIPRTQSSLLESMEERQVTVDGQTYALPDPFFVLATQNPIELEGTFPLPEAQLDRFLLRVSLGYPDKSEEIEIMRRFQAQDPLSCLAAVATPGQLSVMRKARRSVTVSDPVRAYVADIVHATRDLSSIRVGASPRGSLGLMRAAQALAAIRGRQFVLPDDIKYLAVPVLAHRLVLSEAEKLRGTTSVSVLDALLDETAVPGS